MELNTVNAALETGKEIKWNLSFEKEAYQNQHNPGYLSERKWFA